MTATIEQLREAVQKAKTVVFFGGAGVSTESGIPDFRSVDGLYNQKYDWPPETILSHTFFMKKPANCWPWSPRTSTDCTRLPAARRSMNSTAASTGITA